MRVLAGAGVPAVIAVVILVIMLPDPAPAVAAVGAPDVEAEGQRQRDVEHRPRQGLLHRDLVRAAGGDEVDDEQGEKVLKLINALNDQDDVQNVYANFEVSDALRAALQILGRR